MPALAYFSTAPTAGMQSGYADVSLLLNAFTQLRAHGFGANTTQGWWEYSLYVGFTGFFLLVVGVARYLLIESKHNRLNYRWVFAAVLMFLLSLGNTWGILATFQLPFGSIERLSSRFIAIPFLLSVRRQKAEIFLYVLVMFVGIDLFYQLLNWSLIATELASGGPKDIPTMALADTAVAGYKLTVTLAWLLSAVAAATSYLYLRRTQPLHASKLR
jgi:hypothetical protein